MADESLELMKGTLDVLILRTLAWEPMHGYGVSRWIRRQTDGELHVKDGALYQALRRVQEKGWVEARWGVSENNRRARYYSLTERGRDQLRREVATWRRYVRAVGRVLEPARDAEAAGRAT